MYNILITDDEQIAIDSLKFIITKNFEGQVNLFSALSGTDALQIINNEAIDICFMDINMPGMTGLDTVGCINKLKPDTVVVIISAFDRFQYAQEAMNLGVYKYITKPVNRNVVIQTLREAMTLVDNKRGKLFDDRELQKKLDLVSPMIENDFIYSCVFNKETNVDLSSYLQYFNIEEKHYCFCCLEVPRISSDKQYDTYMKIRSLLNEYHRCLVSSFIINRIAVFYPVPENYDSELLKEDFKKIYILLSNKISSGLRMGISKLQNEQNSLVATYNEALNTLNKIDSEGGMLFSGEEADTEISGSGLESVQKKLINRIKIADISGVYTLFDSYFNELTTSETNQNKVKTNLIELLITVKNITLEIDSTYKNQKMDDLFSVFALENDLNNLKNFVVQRIIECVTAISNVKKQKENPTIEKVCKYIDENLSGDLSLETLSSIAKVSTFYLSKLFKEEKSETVTNFVTNKRLDKARAMLTETSDSIKEITAAIGYNDQNYFSRLFKNKFGISPTEFRKN